MKPVSIVSGRAAPLDRSDVDTDQIIPAQWLKRVERTGFGAGLFAQWRDDRSFVLNDPAYQGASILVAGARFGIGSSREHAVWALLDYGFEAVVAPSFGDIFRTNCTKQGLVPVQVSEAVSRSLLDAVTARPDTLVTVDVERASVEWGARSEPFSIDRFTKERLVGGWDDIALTLRHEAQVTGFEATRPAWLPTTSEHGSPR